MEVPSCTEKLHQDLCDKEEVVPSQSQSSPPTTPDQESIKHASLLGQSPVAHNLATSPHHPPTSNQQRPTSSPSSLPGSTLSLSTVRGSWFSSQSASAGIEARSPPSKRAPASRSSHGIATANGPPPALITRRSCHGEPWRTPLAVDRPDPPSASLQQSRTNASGTPTLTRRNSLNSGTDGDLKLDTMNGILGGHLPTSSDRYPRKEDDDDDTLRTFGGTRRTNSLSTNTHGAGCDSGPEDHHSYSSHEDLFLHLARTDSEAGSNLNSTKGTSRRDSQLGLSTSRSVRTSRPVGSRPASSGQEIDGHRSEDQRSHWSRSSHFDITVTGRHSSPRDRGYAASAHPLDPGKRRYLHSELSSKPSFTTPRLRNGNGTNRETSPELPVSYGRRQSITESASGMQPRNNKYGGRSYISGNHYGSSPIANISPNVDPTRIRQSSCLDGTESTISTTAPSTVWDELDDLKSRIRKLELTGKLPSSSGAAVTGAPNDRPHTATTTLTTASVSPKNRRTTAVSPEASTVKETDISSLHPLLHSALAKAQSWIDPKAYEALESTTSDALTLAAMTSYTKSSSEQDAVKGTTHTIDRQFRRKADSMCRSLTELCIALSEEKSSKETSAPTSTSRPGSKAGHKILANVQTPENGHSLRGSSQEPERSSSRIMSQLEARRSSLLAANTATPPNHPNMNDNSQTNSPIVHHHGSSTPTQPSTRTDRTSSVLLRRRRTLDGNNNNNNNDNADSLYANHTGPSPRTTITAASSSSSEQRPSLMTRISREYTSQHPLPTLSHTQRSPSVRSSLPLASARRSYFPTVSDSPPTPNYVIQPGSRRYISSAAGDRQTPPSASSRVESNTQRLAEARQQRIASLGQYSNGGSGRLRLVEGEIGG
ncbi:MAG: hypothetical protein LQ343_000620 [Gyalolechia ehrenbergii]|nr:MAG: hypothetical protein LQ343_000620 [Gyalolechia ehrenbergii]